MDDLLQNNFIPSNSVMYRWRFNGIDKIEDSFHQDILPGDYYIHLLHAQKGKIGFIDKTMSCYRRHSGGIWWNSGKDNDKHYLDHGLNIVNFYYLVEKYIAPDKESYSKIAFSNIYPIILNYLKYKKFDEIQQIINLFPDFTQRIAQYNREDDPTIKGLNQQIKNLSEHIKELEKIIEDLKLQNKNLTSQLNNLTKSKSWVLTKPFRFIMRKIK